MGIILSREAPIKSLPPSWAQDNPSTLCLQEIQLKDYFFFFLLKKKSLFKIYLFQLFLVTQQHFVVVWGLPLVALSGGYSSFQCTGICGSSFCRARALGAWASVVIVCGLSSCDSWALEHRLNSCGTWAQLLCSRWNLTGPGIETVSPASAGRFLSTAPQEKSLG